MTRFAISFLVATLLALPQMASAQIFTKSASTMPAGVLLAKGGWSGNHTPGAWNHTLGNAVINAPLHDHVEFNIHLASYCLQTTPDGFDHQGWNVGGLGLKLQAPTLPLDLDAAVKLSVTVPMPSQVDEHTTTPSLYVALARSLGPAEFRTNVGRTFGPLPASFAKLSAAYTVAAFTPYVETTWHEQRGVTTATGTFYDLDGPVSLAAWVGWQFSPAEPLFGIGVARTFAF